LGGNLKHVLIMLAGFVSDGDDESKVAVASELQGGNACI
jgi:hypothetical protein